MVRQSTQESSTGAMLTTRKRCAMIARRGLVSVQKRHASDRSDYSKSASSLQALVASRDAIFENNF